MRASGILMHITCLPSRYGIGSIGGEARRFADFLREAGQHFWQILPIGPTSYGDSPYQSCSTYAGNPYLIDLDLLARDGLLTEGELEDNRFAGDRVDYCWLYETRLPLLRRAYQRGWERDREAVEDFCSRNPWLEDYTLFMALKASHGMRPWAEWPEALRLRRQEAIQEARQTHREDIQFYTYLQFLFFRQWNELRDYVNQLGLEIIGDIPIYVPYDSADVWANPQLFQLDESGLPTGVAGCPPDGFTAEGQLWGNPLYDWETMKKDGYHWWMGRIASAAKSFDVIRIDHFRGLESYWAVPYGDKTAARGEWKKGPGQDFIDALHQNFPDLKLIAEDLGFLTPEVVELQRASGYPGMKVLEFAFDEQEPGNYLPENYEKNAVCYTGTHDNETLVQWMENASKETIAFAMKYLKVKDKKNLTSAIIKAGMDSNANWFIAPIQDYLGLGSDARMNEPSTLSTKNWSWRLDGSQLTPALAERIAHLTREANRIPLK